MSKTKFIYWGMLVLILAISYGTIYLRGQTLTSGKTVFVPLVKESPVTLTDKGILLNFKNIIPGKQKLDTSGTIVVYINSFGVVSFVRTLEGKNADDLAFGEHLLDYSAYRPAGFYATKKPKVFFGARYLPFPSPESNTVATPATGNIFNTTTAFDIYKRARYLVLRVSPSGRAVPIGLVDRNYIEIKPKSKTGR